MVSLADAERPMQSGTNYARIKTVFLLQLAWSNLNDWATPERETAGRKNAGSSCWRVGILG